MKRPKVSIIVTTKNEKRVIGNLLKSLQAQTYKPIEIIVVDNNSTDKTKEIARKYTKLVFNKGPERSRQRNFGAKKAKGKYVLILDADMELEPGVVKECVVVAESDSQIKAVTIPEKSFGIGFWAKCKALERNCYLGDETIEAARFFEKRVFWEFGGYDESMTGPEDWDLPQRIGKKYKIGRIKSYIIHDEGKAKLLNYLKRKFYYGLSASKYLKKQGKRVVDPSTVYFLRLAFYRNWRKLIQKPILTGGLIILLLGEQISGLLGYLFSHLRGHR